MLIIVISLVLLLIQFFQFGNHELKFDQDAHLIFSGWNLTDLYIYKRDEEIDLGAMMLVFLN